MKSENSNFYFPGGDGSFEFQLPTKIVFGEGVVRKLGGEIKRLGRNRALIGTGTTLGHALSYPLSNRGISHGLSVAIVLPYLMKINRFDADHADELKSLRRKYCVIPEIDWDIKEMAAEVAADERHLSNNARDVTLKEIAGIYLAIKGENSNAGRSLRPGNINL